jgi:hypothetical protein
MAIVVRLGKDIDVLQAQVFDLSTNRVISLNWLGSRHVWCVYLFQEFTEPAV